MPWLSHADYTRIIRENERAQLSLDELARLRAQVLELSGCLESERARSQNREERLIDRVLTSKGAYSVVPAAERKATKKTSASAIPLTAIEDAELKMYIESAVDNGFGPNVGRRFFERDRRRKLEPQADLSEYDDLPLIKPIDEITDEFVDTEANG